MNDICFKVAYLCNGLDPKCSGKVGCYKSASLINQNLEDMRCTHTMNPKFAVNGVCLDPEAEVPQRFKRFVCDKEIRYFEEPDYISEKE